MFIAVLTHKLYNDWDGHWTVTASISVTRIVSYTALESKFYINRLLRVILRFRNLSDEQCTKTGLIMYNCVIVVERYFHVSDRNISCNWR